MNLFYNPEQRRLRAFWRLLLHAILAFVGLQIVGVVGVVAIMFALSARGVLTPEVLGDPARLLQLAQQEMVARPYLNVLTGLLSLLLVLASVWLAGRFLDHRPFRDFGFHFNRRWWADFAFALVLGALLMALIFGIELATGWITVTGVFQSSAAGLSLAGVLLFGAIHFIFVGIYEEVLSRGYQLRNAAEGLNWRGIGPRGALVLAWLLSSLVFGALHAANPNATTFTTVNLALAGLFLGIGLLLTGELAIPIGLHITWNFFQGYVFGFPVSGTGNAGSIITVVQGGPALWTGGAFGPEGGLIGILTLVVGTLLIVAWVRLTRGRVRLEERLAVYQPPTPPGTVPAPSAGPEEETQPLQ